MTVRVTANTTHRTVLIIVIKKKKRKGTAFFHLKLFQTLKFSDYKKIWTLIFPDIFFCPTFFALNVIKDPKNTKKSLIKKPLQTCKPFLIIAITKSFLRIRTLKKSSKRKEKFPHKV